jgi:hypothetical protein
MSLADQLWSQGFTVVKGVFTSEEIAAARAATLDYAATQPTLDNASGKFIPDFSEISALVPISSLRESPALKTALDDCFQGEPYRFCGHCDIGINRVVSGWHKDILNGNYVGYMKTSPWAAGPAGETYRILKVGIYLEDHTDDPNALQVVPGSHLRQDMGTGGAIRLRPAIGDCVIFDQRITHRGMERQVAGSRILVSFGYGANNFFTDAFEAGTKARQRDQLRAIKPAGQ